MFWMGPVRRAGLFLIPAVAGLAAGAVLLAGSLLKEGAPEAIEGKTVRAYVDGEPVRSYVDGKPVRSYVSAEEARKR